MLGSFSRYVYPVEPVVPVVPDRQDRDEKPILEIAPLVPQAVPPVEPVVPAGADSCRAAAPGIGSVATNARVPQVDPLSPEYQPPPNVRSCFGACGTCGGQSWWLTGRGVLVCRTCAPPGSEAADQARSVWDR